MALPMAVNVQNIAMALVAVSVVAFAWEYAMIDSPSSVRPSVPLAWLARTLRTAFEQVGLFWAWVSSFITLIKWEKLVKTADNLFRPLFNIATAWIGFFSGYWQYIRENALSPMAVRCGSVLICVAVLSLAWKLGAVTMIIDYVSQYSVSPYARTVAVLTAIAAMITMGWAVNAPASVPHSE